MSAHIGVLMLDTAFPRVPGDVGNPASYEMPVRFHTVSGADVPDVVRAAAPLDTLTTQFIAGARMLEAGGAVGILTSCGFLGHAQDELARAVRIPVIASALSLGPLIRGMTGGRRLGILTADSRALTSGLLSKAGMAADDVAIAGMEGSEDWRRLILSTKDDQSRRIDTDAIGEAAEGAARGLIAGHPDLGALLLECTNLPPYADRLRMATGLPVFHILHAARLLWDGHLILPQSAG
jgi:Asp/Glu/hydantoin racemase